MTPLHIGLAIAAGLALSAMPFLRYIHVGHALLPHTDHAPRHGAQLRIVADDHIDLPLGPTQDPDQPRIYPMLDSMSQPSG